jgi:hypothetical protein
MISVFIWLPEVVYERTPTAVRSNDGHDGVERDVSPVRS